MSLLLGLPAVLAHPVAIVADTSAALLALPGRLVGLVTSTQQTLTAAHAALARTEALLDRVDGIAGRADSVVHAASQTTTAAAMAVEQAGTLTASAAPLLASYSEPLHRLEPTVRRLTETTEPHEVEALVTLIDRLPDLANAMDHDVLPLLSRLDQLSPDIHQLLDSVSHINRMVNRLPKALRRALGQLQPRSQLGQLDHAGPALHAWKRRGVLGQPRRGDQARTDRLIPSAGSGA